MNATEETADVWTCSLTDCNGHRVGEKCLVCTECGDESLVNKEKIEEVN